MKKINCKLTVLSPLTIGGAVNEANNTEFFYDQQYLYHVNEARVAKALKKEGHVEDFYKFFSAGRGSLQDYLETLPSDTKISLIEGFQARKIPLSGIARTIGVFRPLLLDPLSENPYIPGSSIKGTLRGDLLFLLLEKNHIKPSEIERAVQQSRGKKDRGKVGKIVNRVLESAKIGAKQGPQCDWLRSLKVSDAFCREKEPSLIKQVKVASLNNNGGYHWGARNASIYVEIIKPGTEFEFTVEIDGWLFDIMKRSGQPGFELEELLENDKKLSYLADIEQNFWKQAGYPNINKRHKMYYSQGANLRMGWGSGYLNTTIGAYLDNNFRQQVKDKFYNSRYEVFPNSRKVIVENDTPVDTMGWCRLEKI